MRGFRIRSIKGGNSRLRIHPARPQQLSLSLAASGTGISRLQQMNVGKLQVNEESRQPSLYRGSDSTPPEQGREGNRPSLVQGLGLGSRFCLSLFVRIRFIHPR